VAARKEPQRWSRPRGVCACRQDIRNGGIRQFVGASTLERGVSGHIATARSPGVCADDATEPPPLCGRCGLDSGAL
jgi:hypothetical protein